MLKTHLTIVCILMLTNLPTVGPYIFRSESQPSTGSFERNTTYGAKSSSCRKPHSDLLEVSEFDYFITDERNIYLPSLCVMKNESTCWTFANVTSEMVHSCTMSRDPCENAQDMDPDDWDDINCRSNPIGASDLLGGCTAVAAKSAPFTIPRSTNANTI